MNPDAVVHPIGGLVAARVVGSYDEGFVAGAAKVLEHPQHRVGDSVDVGQEGFGDNRNAHASSVSAAPVSEVASRHTRHEKLVGRYRATMRYLSVLMLTLLLLTGCSSAIAGVAQVDPNGPTTQRSKDGFGIVAGDPKAPIQIELYTEPQCTHCADLQKDVGKQLATYINLGQLAVTYRPMTFLDAKPGGYSDHVANALFLAAGPKTPAKAFQAFVQDLWGHQDPGGTGPSNDEMATMARESGIDAAAVDAIKAGKNALDLKAMADTNFEYLYEIDPVDTGTPTVYDLKKDKTLDLYDNNWLSKLMSS